MVAPLTDPSAPVDIVRYPEGAAVTDLVAVEEPLEIRVDDAPLVVLMRTPGADQDLARGFLLTEGLIDGPDDIVGIAPCRDPNHPTRDNVLLVRLASGSELSADDVARRRFVASSSCGLCGATTIEAIVRRFEPYDGAVALEDAALRGFGAHLAALQPVFAETGGLHGAALFPLAGGGPPLAHAEDVGRHNAVDKIVGALLRAGAWPSPPAVMWVSGRASFEVVQKAIVAGFRALVCVGPPTSMAVSLAQRARLTLVGFATRPGRFNVYVGSVSGGSAPTA